MPPTPPPDLKCSRCSARVAEQAYRIRLEVGSPLIQGKHSTWTVLMCRRCAALLESNLTKGPVRKKPVLPRLERDAIADLAHRGASYREIAAAFGITPAAVSRYHLQKFAGSSTAGWPKSLPRPRVTTVFPLVPALVSAARPEDPPRSPARSTRPRAV